MRELKSLPERRRWIGTRYIIRGTGRSSFPLLRIALMGVLVAACSGTPPAPQDADPTPEVAPTGQGVPSYSGFLDAIATGSTCAELFDIRNAINDVSSDREDDMNDDLRQIGCSSSSSDRTDDGAGLPEEGFSADQYQLGYDICAYDIGQVFDEAGTQDPEEAAAWYAEGTVGSASKGAYAGCLDALNGLPSRYP